MKDGPAQQVLIQTLNRYMTPFAVLLVVLGTVVSDFHLASQVALAIVVLTAISNVVFVRLMDAHPARLAPLRQVRIAFNYFFNIAIVYLLWPYWQPAWMLFLLSIASVAIFEDRMMTVMTAGLFSVVLSMINYERGAHTEAALFEVVAYVGTIWAAGLLINSAVSLLKNSRRA